MSETKTNINRISDNMPNLWDGLNSFKSKIRSNEIIIKPADKGSSCYNSWILLDNVPIILK